MKITYIDTDTTRINPKVQCPILWGKFKLCRFISFEVCFFKEHPSRSYSLSGTSTIPGSRRYDTLITIQGFTGSPINKSYF